MVVKKIKHKVISKAVEKMEPSNIADGNLAFSCLERLAVP